MFVVGGRNMAIIPVFDMTLIHPCLTGSDVTVNLFIRAQIGD